MNAFSETPPPQNRRQKTLILKWTHCCADNNGNKNVNNLPENVIKCWKLWDLSRHVFVREQIWLWIGFIPMKVIIIKKIKLGFISEEVLNNFQTNLSGDCPTVWWTLESLKMVLPVNIVMNPRILWKWSFQSTVLWNPRIFENHQKLGVEIVVAS